MKTRSLFALGVSLAVASQAWANDAPLSADKLGGLDAVISFCSRVNPGGIRSFYAFRASYVGHANDEKLERMPAYAKAFADVSKALNSVPADWAAAACAKPVDHPGDDHNHR